MSKLPGTKVKAIKIQVDGRMHKVEVRMREHGRVAQFAAFCREPRDVTAFIKFHDPKGADLAEWPDHLRVQEFPR